MVKDRLFQLENTITRLYLATMRRQRPDYDPIGVAPTPRRAVVDLEHPCAAMCTNSRGDQLAVVGRRVFKIFQLFPDKIEYSINLRDLPHKQMNLNYSNNDVQWNPQDDSQLASAPTNGSVILWDITKSTKSKLAHVYDGYHQRAVNRLSYHQNEAHVLLSGSQDNSMNIFDTRSKGVAATYKGPDSVRDVKFPTLVNNDYLFASCYDNGVLHIWDRRRGEHPIKTVSCHNGPVYSCAWHPESENIILTSGRDKMIKGINIEGRPRDYFTISTRLSVARAKWRQGHKNHVTSCSHFLDTTVLLWDMRRPFIPFASFSEHTDDVTDFLWLPNDRLLTCSKDGKLIQQLFSCAKRPIENASPVGISFHPDGGVAHACSGNLALKRATHHNNSPAFSTRPSTSQHPISFRKNDDDPYQQSFLLHSSSLREHAGVFQTTESTDERKMTVNKLTKETPKMSAKDIFVKCAESYKLHGLPVYELCDHNYKIAKELSLVEVSQTWLILKLLFCGDDPDCSRMGLIDTTPCFRTAVSSRLSNAPSAAVGVMESGSEIYSTTQGGKDSVATTEARPPTGLKETPPSTAGSVQEEAEEEADEVNGPDVDAALDFFEGSDHDSDIVPQPPPQNDWTEMELPQEPIQLRKDLLRPSSPEHNIDTASGFSTVQSGLESNSSLKPHPTEGHNYRKTSSQTKAYLQWDYSSVVTDMLKFYAEQGDVQMSVSCLLVLGEKAKGLVDDIMLEHWFSSYIDLLSRYKLWVVSALIIKLCPLDVIKEKSQQSTAYHTGCGTCNKLMENRGWQCHRCAKTASLCAVCHGSVRGLLVWCQICGHGGHLQHMQEWHKSHTQCPTGCGHNCVQLNTKRHNILAS